MQPLERHRSSGRRSFRIAGARRPCPDHVRPNERFRESAILRCDRPDQVRASHADRSPADARLRAAVRKNLQRDEIVKKAPSTKLQAPTKLQTPSSKIRSTVFGVWSLVFLWSLVLGIWSF